MGSCDTPVNYPHADSSGMGRLLGAAAKAGGRGQQRGCHWARLGQGWDLVPLPQGEGAMEGWPELGDTE